MNRRIGFLLYVCLYLAIVPDGALAQNALYLDISDWWKAGTGDRPEYAQPEFDDSSWRSVRSPYFSRRVAGVVWIRRTVQLLDGTDPKQMVLTLGSINDFYEVFVNGVSVGGTGPFDQRSWQLSRPRSFAIPFSAAGGTGKLVIAIRSMNLGRSLPLQWAHYAEGPDLITYAINAPQYAGQTSIDQRRLMNVPSFVFAILFFVLGFVVLFIRGENRALELWLFAFLFLVGLREFVNDCLIAESSNLYRWAFIANRFMHVSLAAAYLGYAAAVTGVRKRWFTSALIAAWVLGSLIEFITENDDFAFDFISALLIGGMAVSIAGPFRLGRFSPRAAWLLQATVALVGLAWFNNAVAGWIFVRDLRAGPFLLPVTLLATLVLCTLLVGQVLHLVLANRRESQRLAGEMGAARQLQQLLISSGCPQVPGFEVESAYLPAAEVGGDFFQVLPVADGGVLLVTGDVSGKGLKAAMIVTLLLGTVRNRRSDVPSEVLREINLALQGQLPLGFVTCCCARASADGTVIAASAGHPPPYVDASESDLPVGLPLGLTVEAEYTDCLLRGARFTFVSDGVVEAANAKGELFGFDRTREISTKPAQEIAEAARAWGQNDDITVVTVRRKATA